MMIDVMKGLHFAIFTRLAIKPRREGGVAAIHNIKKVNNILGN
jgi:hypothetical protein